MIEPCRDVCGMSASPQIRSCLSFLQPSPLSTDSPAPTGPKCPDIFSVRGSTSQEFFVSCNFGVGPDKKFSRKPESNFLIWEMAGRESERNGPTNFSLPRTQKQSSNNPTCLQTQHDDKPEFIQAHSNSLLAPPDPKPDAHSSHSDSPQGQPFTRHLSGAVGRRCGPTKQLQILHF